MNIFYFQPISNRFQTMHMNFFFLDRRHSGVLRADAARWHQDGAAEDGRDTADGAQMGGESRRRAWSTATERGVAGAVALDRFRRRRQRLLICRRREFHQSVPVLEAAMQHQPNTIREIGLQLGRLFAETS